jgi:excisionase family DNA binding protein
MTILDFPTPRPQATVKEVAKMLAFSPRKVRDLCHAGELEYTGEGRGMRIYLDSVAAYQERHTKRRAS